MRTKLRILAAGFGFVCMTTVGLAHHGFDTEYDANKKLTLSGVERRVRQAARTAGLRQWGVHRFRVTFATLLYDDGAGIEEIRNLLGHESIETTRRYIDVSERARKTRLSASAQHVALGTRNTSGPRWLAAALGGGQHRE